MTQYINLVFGESVESMFLYATAVVCLATICILYLFLSGPIGTIPGPSLAKLSRVWLIWHSRKGDMHRKMIDLHAIYGTLVRTGPNEISVSDLDAIKTIYGKASSNVPVIVLTSLKDMEANFERAIGIVYFKDIENSIFLQSVTREHTVLNVDS